MMKTQRGIISVLALLMLVVLSVLAVTMATVTQLNTLKSDNSRNALEARLAAESGLDYMLMIMRDMQVPETTEQTPFLADFAAALGERLTGTPTLSGASITNSGTEITIPSVSLPEGSFTASLTWIDSTHCRLESLGTCGGASRRLRMDFQMVPRRSPVFDHGIAAKGQLRLHGGARIKGSTDPNDASILSASATHDDAVLLDGGIVVDGDVYAAGAGSYVATSGSPEIAGSTDPEVYGEHVHSEVEVPDFPEVNTAPFAALAINLVDSSTDISSSGLVLNNIRIAAGTNPTFNSDVTINGIVYIETPNIVSFSGQATLNGMIATQDSEEPIENCQISFSGGVTANGVEALPDTEEFADIKQYTGTFIVAPGFAVSFAGNCSITGGIIAADQLTFTGTANGTIQGSVIAMGDQLTTFGGNVSLFVDHENLSDEPAGFVGSLGITPLPDTYTECVGG